MSMQPGAWRQVEILGRPADVFEPAQLDPRGRVVMHLHGHGLGTLKDNAVFTAEFERHGFRCICPHGQRSWWLDVVCREFDPTLTPMQYLREHVVPWIAQEWGISPPNIALTGNSMGGQGVFQLSYRHPREFPVAVGICPAIDFHQWYGQGLPIDEMFSSREQARQHTAVLQIHPLNWPKHQMLLCDPTDHEWIDGCERLTSKLSSIGIPYVADFRTSHGGHTWEYVNAMAKTALDFIAERL
ncbi:MAG: hypothetical protein IT428_25285 [Planctomycetaceae bacterium]|nr:hypothetical protein [Planctomycetaceae bacterium]